MFNAKTIENIERREKMIRRLEPTVRQAERQASMLEKSGITKIIRDMERHRVAEIQKCTRLLAEATGAKAAKSVASLVAPRIAIRVVPDVRKHLFSTAGLVKLPPVATSVAARAMLEPTINDFNAYGVRQATELLSVIRPSSLLTVPTARTIENLKVPRFDLGMYKPAMFQHLFAPFLRNIRPFERIVAPLRSLFERYEMLWDIPIVRKAYDIFQKFLLGRFRLADRFIEDYLGLSVSEEMRPYFRESLWRFLKRSFDNPFTSLWRWAMLPLGEAKRYMQAAVRRNAYRLKAHREMEDKPFGGRENAPRTLVLDEARYETDLYGTLDDHASLMENQDNEIAKEWHEVLTTLLTEGTEYDRRLVEMIRSGDYTLNDLRTEVGNSRLQSFQRKVQRRKRNHRSGVRL
jgi:hypothetical protein